MLNQYLNAHLEWQDHELGLWDLYAFLPQYQGKPDPEEPFMCSEDRSRPSEERLAQLEFIYLDGPALELYGYRFLERLPGLRELHIYAPEAMMDIDFLALLPQLRFLQLHLKEVVDQQPLLELQQLETLFLEFRTPDLQALKTLPKLSSVYFDPAEPLEVKDFLEHFPDCRVEFCYDEEEAPRFIVSRINGMELRWFDLAEKDRVSLYIEPLLPWEDYEDRKPTSAELQEFHRCCAQLQEQVLAQYQREDNFLARVKLNYRSEHYSCDLYFQRLYTWSRKELEEALEDFRRLSGSGFSRDKMEWWLLKHEDFLIYLLHSDPALQPEPGDDDPLRYERSAESSFKEAHKKLHRCVHIGRHRGHWEALWDEVRQLDVKDRAAWFQAREKELKFKLSFPLQDLDLREDRGRLKLEFKGYMEEVQLPKEAFEAARELEGLYREWAREQARI